MTKVTNQSTVSVTVVGTDGSSESLRPNETKHISFDSNHKRNRAYLNSRAISVEGRSASNGAPRKASRSSSRKATKSSTKKAPVAPAEGSTQT